MASFIPEDPAAGTEMATRMLESGQEHINNLQSLFTERPPDYLTEVYRVLLDDVSQCVGMALSALKALGKAMKHGDETAHGDRSPSSDGHLKSKDPPAQKRKRPNVEREVEDRSDKRKDAYSLRIITAAPFDDGYQWRKYGQKSIQGATYPRNYFRCTYKEEQGCPATKQVQRRDNDDPPMFLAMYTHKHTCKDGKNSPHIILESSPAEKFSLSFNRRCEAVPWQQISLPQTGGQEHEEHRQEIWANPSQLADHGLSASEWMVPLEHLSITTPEIAEGELITSTSSLGTPSPDMELLEKWLNEI